MRAAAVFLTSVVMFAAMVVIAHSLKSSGDGATFGASASRELTLDDAAETGADQPWPDPRADLGPLGQVGSAPSEPTPVVTAEPVPDDDDDAGTTTALTTPPGGTIVATPLPDGGDADADRGTVTTRRDPAPAARPADPPAAPAAPAPAPPAPVTPQVDPEPTPTPTPSPTPSESETETGSEPAGLESVDATAEAVASEGPGASGSF